MLDGADVVIMLSILMFIDITCIYIVTAAFFQLGSLRKVPMQVSVTFVLPFCRNIASSWESGHFIIFLGL